MTTKVQGDMYDIDGATVATVAAGDKINFLDITDSLVKEDTVQGILDLVPSAGFTLGTEQATTSGTSKTFSGIPAGTKMIILTLKDCSFTGANNLDLTIGDSGGLETSGYQSASTVINGGSLYTSGSTAEFIVKGDQATTMDLNGHAILTLEDSSDYTWSCSHQFEQGGAPTWGSGTKSLSAELTQLQISGGTFSTGVVNISYL